MSLSIAVQVEQILKRACCEKGIRKDANSQPTSKLAATMHHFLGRLASVINWGLVVLLPLVKKARLYDFPSLQLPYIFLQPFPCIATLRSCIHH